MVEPATLPQHRFTCPPGSLFPLVEGKRGEGEVRCSDMQGVGHSDASPQTVHQSPRLSTKVLDTVFGYSRILVPAYLRRSGALRRAFCA